MRKVAMLAAVAVLSVALTACGGGNNANNAANSPSANTPANGAANSAGAAEGNVVDITASNFKFDKDEYRVKAGDVTINLHNAEGVHGIAISNTKVKLKGGESETVTLSSPGEYEITCNIPCGTGHVKMKAKLIVEA